VAGILESISFSPPLPPSRSLRRARARSRAISPPPISFSLPEHPASCGIAQGLCLVRLLVSLAILQLLPLPPSTQQVTDDLDHYRLEILFGQMMQCVESWSRVYVDSQIAHSYSPLSWAARMAS